MSGKITPALEARLREAEKNLEATAAELASPGLGGAMISRLQKKYGALAPLVERYRSWREALRQVEQAAQLRDDIELGELAAEEEKHAAVILAAEEKELLARLAPENEDDNKDVFVEIRAGTGGVESSLFASDLLRMYAKWAERNGLTLSPVSISPSEQGGYKEAIAKVEGRNACSLFKHEAGAHRVQRVPETESQGRIHTSICTVAVLPEAALEDAGIDKSDLRFDTYRSSGAGGQHVNTTDSAVRITHLPTGLVAESQDDRSQHRNRERALEIIAARVHEHRKRERIAAESSVRREMVGSGERADKIRTYNFPQGRVTDHRVGITLRCIREIMEGDLFEIHAALARAERAELIARSADEIN